jgi:hypothetical protein
LIVIRVEPECRSVARSLSGWGPKGEPDAPIAAESEITKLLRMLKLIRRSDSSMLAIRVETEYRFLTRSFSGLGPEGEPPDRCLEPSGDNLVVVLPACYETLEL